MITNKIIRDAGVAWTQANITTTGKVIAGSQSDSLGIYYSDPETEIRFPKYLDQKGAQEIVTQFKAFVDNLVGGN